MHYDERHDDSDAANSRAGLALLVAGWLILFFAMILLSSPALRYVFVIAGILVELLGLGMVGLHHRAETGGKA